MELKPFINRFNELTSSAPATAVSSQPRNNTPFNNKPSTPLSFNNNISFSNTIVTSKINK